MSTDQTSSPAGHYADINGPNLYYEIHGSGKPLVLIHGGGSTLESTFGYTIPVLQKKYQLIAVEMQAHGHTKDRGQQLSFEQDADDVAALLDLLHIERAVIFGFSNGATTALQMSIRHPQKVERLILASPLYNRTGVDPQFWEGFKQANLSHMPKALQDAYLKVNPDQQGLQRMFDRDVERMKNFRDIPDDLIRTVQMPALIINSEQDVILPEHAVALYRLLPAGRLIILPGYHGEWMNAAESAVPNNPLPALAIPMLEQFLDTSIAQAAD